MNDLSLILNSEYEKQETKKITQKILNQERINNTEALYLFNHVSISTLSLIASYIKHRLHKNNVYFNRNFHIEPTNVCVFSCKFCAYSCSYKHKEEGWELSIEQMMQIVKKYDHQPITEVHIVGGVHPKMNLDFFVDLLQKIKKHRPQLHIKAFTAVELDYMFRKAKLSIHEGFQKLKQAGLDSIPGGGAEIFDSEIRQQICADKVDANQWLKIHETAHNLSIPSNATMLYGHIENYTHRIHHLDSLRQLQDKTKGFNTFIPLKFRNQNNEMSDIKEVSIIEDMKMYAISRIYLDNIPHLKAYWPMLGRYNAQLTLAYGVDDLDGTIDDSTKIYSMAGSQEQNPAITTEDLVALIHQSQYNAIERDTLYNTIKKYEKPIFS